MAKWSSEMRGMNPVKWWSFHGWSKTGPEKWWENSHQIGSLWSCTGLVLGTNLANELVPHQECPVGQNRGPGAGIPSIIIYLLLTSINSLYHCWYTPMKNHLPLYTSSISSIPSLGKHSPLSTSRGTTWSAASILMDPEMSRTQMMSTGTRSPCAWRRGFLALLGKNTPENPRNQWENPWFPVKIFPKKPIHRNVCSFHRKITCWTMRTMISIVMWSLSADFGSLKQFCPLDFFCQNRHYGESKRS